MIKYYHIYNRGINSCNLFEQKSDFEYFLKLYEKYIDHVANTYAWCLMPNHFHFLIRIKDEDEIGYYKPLNSGRSKDSTKFKVTYDLSEFKEPERVSRKPNPTRHLSHLLMHIQSILTKNTIDMAAYLRNHSEEKKSRIINI